MSEQHDERRLEALEALTRLLGVLRGGTMPSAGDLVKISELNITDREQTELTWGQGAQAIAPFERAFAAQMVFLAQRIPGKTIAEAKALLTEQELAEYRKLGEVE